MRIAGGGLRRPRSRRTAGGAGLVTACTGERDQASNGDKDPPTNGEGFVASDGEQVRAAEARRNPGQVRDFRLAATTGPVDLGGLTVNTWSYDGRAPGPPAGEVVRATFANELPAELTTHWHGIALRNDADGVPHLTRPPIAPGLDQLPAELVGFGPLLARRRPTPRDRTGYGRPAAVQTRPGRRCRCRRTRVRLLPPRWSWGRLPARSRLK